MDYDKKQNIHVDIEALDDDLSLSTQQSAIDYFKHENTLASALKSRHLGMLTLVGVFGTGLFLSSGATLATAGPVGMLLGYSFVGLVVGFNQMCITELVCLMPVTSGYVKHAEHFFDDAWGFMLGWIDVYSNVLPTELSAVAVVMSYWTTASPAIFITVFGLVIVAVNGYNIRWYGEIEFFFGCLKIMLVIGLCLTGLIIDLGGVSGVDRIGFRYWKNPGPFAAMYTTGSMGKFAAFFKAINSIVYAYGGLQSIVSVLASEAEYPRRTVYRASRRVFYRSFAMYLCTVFVLTLILPYNDKAIASPTGNAAGSPFVIAIKRAGIPVLPHIINAIVLTSALSASNLQVAKASRTLFALASKKQAPKIFLTVNKHKLPYVGVIFSCAFIPLAYMSISSSSSTVFSWFQNLTSSSILLNWIAIALNHIFMMRAMNAQGYTRDKLPYTFKLAVFGSWFSLLFSVIFLLIGGFPVFIKGHFSIAGLFSAYFIIPLAAILYLFWKFLKKTEIKNPKDVDLKNLFQDALDKPEPPFPKKTGWDYLKLIWD
ncbi:uncharacterized protein KQ657_004933 [Scheffersomyces spartinae]|uniref:Amino acid permease/ SLC12A domain-containing protein n=1 Tax=Scheffersomyces spartinae TaxID=45513 RepID=A0A9P8AIZ9_9ASCO|nr:uncharacterized protein KQ657_004933 [Scheffersomyces spartinae]KAG7194220.1 hypothetical protein KQ657_004933 [Scheffersomyces spartinae]